MHYVLRVFAVSPIPELALRDGQDTEIGRFGAGPRGGRHRERIEGSAGRFELDAYTGIKLRLDLRRADGAEVLCKAQRRVWDGYGIVAPGQEELLWRPFPTGRWRLTKSA